MRFFTRLHPVGMMNVLNLIYIIKQSIFFDPDSFPFFSGKRIDFIPNINKNMPARSTAEAVNAFISFFSLRSFFLRNFFFRDIKQLLIENIALIGYLKKNAKR